MFNAHEGTLSQGRVGRSWWRRYPTWKEMDASRFKRASTGRWTVQARGMVSNGEPFMVTIGRGQSKLIGGGKSERRGLAPSIFMPVSSLCRAVEYQTKEVGKWSMVGCNPLSREGSREGCNYTRGGGNQVAGGSGMDAKEIQSLGTGGENLGERRFNLENSSAERRSLHRLEREMNSSILFEHGGGQRASPLWVARILLGRLFQECLVLGQAVKMFVKFQRREIMRCMVKLNDLEELVEPLLGGNSRASTSDLPKDTAMDLDEADGLQDVASADAQFSPNEANFGLV